MNNDNNSGNSSNVINDLARIEQLEIENKRLNDFCKEFVYGETNPEYYKTMDAKILEVETELDQTREVLIDIGNMIEGLVSVCDSAEWHIGKRYTERYKRFIDKLRSSKGAKKLGNS